MWLFRFEFTWRFPRFSVHFKTLFWKKSWQCFVMFSTAFKITLTSYVSDPNNQKANTTYTSQQGVPSWDLKRGKLETKTGRPAPGIKSHLHRFSCLAQVSFFKPKLQHASSWFLSIFFLSFFTPLLAHFYRVHRVFFLCLPEKKRGEGMNHQPLQPFNNNGKDYLLKFFYCVDFKVYFFPSRNDFIFFVVPFFHWNISINCEIFQTFFHLFFYLLLYSRVFVIHTFSSYFSFPEYNIKVF